MYLLAILCNGDGLSTQSFPPGFQIISVDGNDIVTAHLPKGEQVKTRSLSNITYSASAHAERVEVKSCSCTCVCLDPAAEDPLKRQRSCRGTDHLEATMVAVAGWASHSTVPESVGPALL